METEGKAKTRIADKINLSAIQFERGVHHRLDKAVVTFASSAGSLFFNPKMVELLNMKDWKQVIVGGDRSSSIIVLKRCDVEEYGAVMLRIPYSSTKDGKRDKYRKREKKCRLVSIGHLVRTLGLTTTKYYRAERDGVMVFLEPIKYDDGQ